MIEYTSNSTNARGWGKMLKALALVFVIQAATFAAVEGADAGQCQKAFPFKQEESLTKSCREMYNNGKSDILTKRITLRKCMAEVLLMAQCEKDSYDNGANCICKNLADASSAQCSTKKSTGTVELQCYSPLVGEKKYYCKKGSNICDQNECSNGWHSPRMTCGAERLKEKVWPNSSGYGFDKTMRVTPGYLPNGYEVVGKE